MSAPQNEVSLIQEDTQAIDDCWNRIGIHGVRSCPLLVEHIHCRNCAVYSAAATRLLDRYSLVQEQRIPTHSSKAHNEIKTRSVLIFRLGEEWLGLPTRCLIEVAPLQAIHSLPHQRSRALLGVANVRGALVACVSLVELLGLDSTAVVNPSNRIMPRMLIITAEGGPAVVPVDEVDGIHAIDQGTLDSASNPGQHANAKYTRGVIRWKARSLRLLDEDQLLSAMNRSFS
ncbi:chemotaxis protein CheW [Pseudomonas sp. 10B1]|uniref:chemotaxis protein CheW n=1 Tax=unclassified Pseudomonas TaxID=196821 RepID=UPI002AB4B7BE|nr:MULTISPECIES: chemotaxis protein CheW [unclassified Pseudomonas]MDY7559294.1 chemotaxis protein CheW [Pseudomonas sp. AB6]MEA9979347.1 chemotaxis protein CheW [Pseudomonas sp. RTS4]MEA9994112.1 chemotaxis protein CheW [Pseudomonas sp. AA4]MEB0086253.1 chemotaxis protein CheW [Pseudomonas sp. RTI1]MEB0125041.1 chemotaxis protein CheW [Pseudomonas sp. CCC1.2]